MLRSLVVSLVTIAGFLPATAATAAVTPLTLGKGDFPGVASTTPAPPTSRGAGRAIRRT